MTRAIFRIAFLLLSVALVGCGKSDHEHHDGKDGVSNGDNEVAEELDQLHKEAMEKMGELFKLKKQLKNKLDSSTTMVEDRKQDVEKAIARLDSAYDNMMDWMHHYNPQDMSVDSTEYHKYIKDEMEKMKKIKNDILDAIQRAREENE